MPDDTPRSTHTSNREIGTIAEKKAAEYLENKSYKILATNYRLRNGEIDIIAQDGAYIVFIEVKYRRNLNYGYPREAVTKRKQNTIRTIALHFLSARKLYNRNIRFDVIEMIQGMDITHIENAF